MQPSIIPRGSIYSIASGPSISRGLHRRKNSGAIERTVARDAWCRKAMLAADSQATQNSVMGVRLSGAVSSTAQMELD